MYKEGKFVLKVGEQCTLMEGQRILANDSVAVLKLFLSLDFDPPSHLDSDEVEELQGMLSKAVLTDGWCIAKVED